MQRAVHRLHYAWHSQLIPGVSGYRTGHMARSLTTQVTPKAEAVTTKHVEGIVGTNVFYAPYLEFGTGIYGPRRRPITVQPPGRLARSGSGRPGALQFPGKVGPGTPFTWAGRRRSGRAGAMAQYVYRRSVKGIRPRHYATKAADIARPLVEAEFREGGRIASERIARSS